MEQDDDATGQPRSTTTAVAVHSAGFIVADDVVSRAPGRRLCAVNDGDGVRRWSENTCYDCYLFVLLFAFRLPRVHRIDQSGTVAEWTVCDREKKKQWYITKSHWYLCNIHVSRDALRERSEDRAWRLLHADRAKRLWPADDGPGG